MTLRYMLDSNVCIYVMKGAPRALMDRFNAEEEALCISSISLAELRYGVAKSAVARREANAAGVERFTSRLLVVPFEERAAAEFGDIKAALFRAGTPCGPNDLLIGAHARSLDLTLVTNNRREFDRMPGLKVENWV